MSNTAEWLAALQDNGYRLTAPRRAVVEIVASSQHALNPFEVFELARQHYPRLGLVTVYRTLEKLEEIGKIQRVHQPSGCQAFITAFTGHQHLLICRACGKVAFFKGDEDKIDSLIHAVGKENGYEIDEHWLQFFGLCLNCQAVSNP